MQKLENISNSLQFLMDQGIKLTGIGASHIANGDKRLILGKNFKNIKLFIQSLTTMRYFYIFIFIFMFLYFYIFMFFFFFYLI